MQDEAKTKEQLIIELRERVAELEKNQAERKRTEEALKEAERKFRAIFDQTFQFMGLLTIDGRLIEANRTALQFAGVQESDVIGKPFWETPWWTHSTELQEMLRVAVKKAAAGELVRFETAHFSADGSLHSMDFSLKAIIDETGGVAFLIAEARDIDERKRAEEALRESEARLRQIIDLVPHKIFVKGLDGKYLLVNKAVADAYNTSVSALTGKCQADFHPDESELQNMLQDDREVITKGETKFIPEEPYTDAQGNLRFLQTTKVPFHILGDKTPAALGVAIDITDKKRAEEVLRESEEKFRTLVESAPEPIFILKEGRFAYVNDPAIRLYGASSEEELLGHDIVERVYPDYRARILKRIRTINNEGKPALLMEQKHVKLDGTIIDVEAISAPIRYRNSDGSLVFVRDVTERKRMEEALRESKAYLAAAIDSMPCEFWVMGPNGFYTMQNSISRKRFGDIIGKRPEDVCPNRNMLSVWLDYNRRAFSGELVREEATYLFGDEERHFYNVVAPIRDAGRTLGIVGVDVDITARKLLEAALKKVNTKLESQVEERTKELNAKTRSLEEFNAALNVLLEKREEDKRELEESILLNVKSLIVPYVEKLKKSRLNNDQMTYLTILESHMREITSPFTKRLSEKYLGLSPLEVRTASLLKEGKTTLEIAELLCISENTVSSHRFHIRKKLGLSNKKVNLRSYLKSIDK